MHVIWHATQHIVIEPSNARDIHATQHIVIEPSTVRDIHATQHIVIEPSNVRDMTCYTTYSHRTFKCT